LLLVHPPIQQKHLSYCHQFAGCCRTGGQDRGTVLLSCFHMRLDADELRIFLEGPCQGDQPEDDGLKRLLDAETIARLREVSGCGKIQADWWIA